MSNRILALAVFGFLAVAAIAPGTRAATIDTHDFTQDGYTAGGFPGVLTGSFTGAVEADGLIELADLSSANVQIIVSPPLSSYGFSVSLSLISLFSFNTNGGSGTFDLIAADLCVGGVAVVGSSLGGCGPGGFAGEFFSSPALFTTQNLPVITLVSSVTVAPEPSTWAMMLLGFAGLGFVGYRGSRKSNALTI